MMNFIIPSLKSISAVPEQINTKAERSSSLCPQFSPNFRETAQLSGYSQTVNIKDVITYQIVFLCLSTSLQES